VNLDSKKRSAVPKLRERIREATCDAIAAAAEELFAERGVQGAHVGDIAARAGVSVGTLYNHFEDREAILAALLARRRAELVEALDAVLDAGADLPFRDQLRNLVRAVFDHFEAHRRFFSILLEGEHLRERGAFPASTTKPRETIQEVYRRIEVLMKRGVRQKALRAKNAELYPAFLMGIVKGVLVRELYEGEASPVPRYVDAVLSLFLDGAAAEHARERP
jgi:AcrR family transcriptional regulator